MLTQPPLLPPLSPYLARQDADRKSGFLDPDRRHRESVHAFRTTKEGLARASQKCLCRRTSPPLSLTQPPLLPHISRARTQIENLDFCILTDVTESPYTLSERQRGPGAGQPKVFVSRGMGILTQYPTSGKFGNVSSMTIWAPAAHSGLAHGMGIYITRRYTKNENKIRGIQREIVLPNGFSDFPRGCFLLVVGVVLQALVKKKKPYTPRPSRPSRPALRYIG